MRGACQLLSNVACQDFLRLITFHLRGDREIGSLLSPHHIHSFITYLVSDDEMSSPAGHEGS